MGELVNLRRARKDREKRQREEQAQANRVEFGRGKAERKLTAAEAKLERDRFESHRLDVIAKPEDGA